MMISIQGAVRLSLVLCTLVLASSCYRLKGLEGQTTEVITAGDLGSRVEFAVAPIIDVRPVRDSDIPEAQLRKAFQLALLKRRYSPLSLDYVDGQATEAGYHAGASQEEATLQITIEDWDSSLWQIKRALNVQIEVVAIDPNGPAGSVLWRARSERRFDKGAFGDPSRQPTEMQRLQHACNVIATEILSAMPARTEAPGRL